MQKFAGSDHPGCLNMFDPDPPGMGSKEGKLDPVVLIETGQKSSLLIEIDVYSCSNVVL